MQESEKRFDPHRKDRLISSERFARWNPPVFLARFDLRPGMTILDLGCGPGFWTLPLAELVGPTGLVWAIDASQELLDSLAERKPPPQVRPRKGTLPNIDLASRSVDFAWIALVFHEVDRPDAVAAETLRVLKPSGRLALLEWRPDGISDHNPPRDIRITPDQLCTFLSSAGFVDARMTWQDDDNYLIEASHPITG